MNNTLSKRLCLTAMLTLAAVVYTTSAFAETSKLVIESEIAHKVVRKRLWKRNNGTTLAVCARK